MKKSIIIAATVAALTTGSAPVFADARMDTMRECMAVEQNKPDSSRGGASASEFCAAYAILKTQGLAD